VQKADQTIRTASKKEFSLARADCELQDTANKIYNVWNYSALAFGFFMIA